MPSVKVLGAYGGKYDQKHTSSFVVSDAIVIDAGNLVVGLGEKAPKVRHIFLTHSHFDHIIDIPFLIDAVFTEIDDSITVYGLPHTIKTLKTHLLNDEIWPDFSRLHLPANGKPAIVYREIEIGATYEIDGYAITPVAANHVVPACGYVVEHGGAAVMLSGDTYLHEGIAATVNANAKIVSLILEVSFPSRMRAIAEESRHLTPELAAAMLADIRREGVTVYIYHMKPGYETAIEEELSKLLENGMEFRMLDDYETVPYDPPETL
jgi:ribonuclease BN (tRNA processing enzyme)